MLGQPTTRSRKVSGPLHVCKGGYIRLIDGVLNNVTTRTESWPGKQTTVSEGNHWPPRDNEKLMDRGSPFFTTKSWVLHPTTLNFVKIRRRVISTEDAFYEGPCIVARPTASTTLELTFPENLVSTDTQLDSYGATAIDRCKPTNSIADASTFLGELVREGLPNLVGSTLWRSKTSQARRKAAGGEYLNVQFGWAPLVGEISKFAEAVRKADKVIAQYERDSGKVVRRRYEFPIEKTNTEVVIATNQLPRGFGLSEATNQTVYYGRVIRQREVVRRRWFSGAFTYYLPSGYDSRNGMVRMAAQAEKLFGINLTPETLWNVAPWSWAVDWFSNTGDVISNLEDFKRHGLIMHYGYMMEHTIVTDTYSHEYNTKNNPSLPRVSTLVLRTESKKRRPANPFGFGVKWEGLSPFQLSIAAALGLSRGR